MVVAHGYYTNVGLFLFLYLEDSATGICYQTSLQNPRRFFFFCSNMNLRGQRAWKFSHFLYLAFPDVQVKSFWTVFPFNKFFKRQCAWSNKKYSESFNLVVAAKFTRSAFFLDISDFKWKNFIRKWLEVYYYGSLFQRSSEEEFKKSFLKRKYWSRKNSL